MLYYSSVGIIQIIVTIVFNQRASKMARHLGVPFIYLSANSGARLGLAEEIKPLFRVAWEDSANPDKGFKYLYLTPDDFKKVSATNSVHTELIDDGDEARYKITCIIGNHLFTRIEKKFKTFSLS
jgi:hypothetical protein